MKSAGEISSRLVNRWPAPIRCAPLRNYSREMVWGGYSCQPRCAVRLRMAGGELLAPFFLDIDIQALDFLIQRGERDSKLFGGLGLVPVTFLEHIDNDVAFAVFHDVEQRGVSAMFEHGESRTPPGDVIRKQLRPNFASGRKHHGAFHDVLEFADIAGKGIGEQRAQALRRDA